MKGNKIFLKIFLSLLVLLLCCAFFACGDDDGQTDGNAVITLNESKVSLDLYERLPLSAEIKNSESAVSWTSSDSNIVKYENGFIVPVSDGTAIITASIGEAKAECKITVSDSGARPNFDFGYENATLFVGSAKSINAKINYKGHNYDDFTVEYITDDDSVARIENNRITAIKKGETEYTVKYSWRGFRDITTVKVKVKNAIAFGFEKNAVSLFTVANFDSIDYQTEYVLQPCLNINGQNQSGFIVEYENLDSDIVSVDANGKVKSIDCGEAHVKAKCLVENELYEANILVKVDFPTKILNERFFINLSGESKLDVKSAVEIGNALRVYDSEKNLISDDIEDGVFSLSVKNRSEYDTDKLFVYTEDKTGFEISAEYVTSIIYDKQDLNNMRTASKISANSFGGYYVLANDIDYGGGVWTPWCSYYVGGAEKAYSFVGTFDGNGYSILNMTFNYTGNAAYSFKGNGFIGQLSKNGTIRNVSFLNCTTYMRTVQSTNSVGIGLYGVVVCGNNRGTIENVYVEMPAANFKISGPSIESARKQFYIFSVDESAGKIENCFANITGEKEDSEITIYGATTRTVNTNVNIIGDVSSVMIATDKDTGREITDNKEIKVYSTVNAYKTQGTKLKYDKAVWNTDGDIPKLKNYRETIILGVNLADVDLSDNGAGTYKIPFSTAVPTGVTVNGNNVDFNYSAEKINISKSQIAEIGCGEQTIAITTPENRYVAKITVATKILKTKQDIYDFPTLAKENYVGDNPNHYGGYYIVANDITCDGWGHAYELYGSGWRFNNDNPFKYGFYGTFDGRGHTLKNLYINNPSYANPYGGGMFGHIVGTVKNLSIEDPLLSAPKDENNQPMNQAIVCGANGGKVENVSVIYKTGGISNRTVCVFGIYHYYQNAESYGTFNNCEFVIAGATTGSDVYFCCKNNSLYHFNNCIAVLNNDAAITTYSGAGDSSVTVYLTASGVNMSNFDTSVWNTTGSYPVLIKQNVIYA